MDKIVGRFIWNRAKERENIEKHRVDFNVASRAFFDPKKKIYSDSKHSKREERFFYIGKVKNRVITVPLDLRTGKK